MMNATRPRLAARLLPYAAALTLGSFGSAALASAALAQDGTPEQREACAPDAVRLCENAIPDVERTTACMKRHEAELSPRCHAVFLDATEPREDRSRRASRAGDVPGEKRYLYLAPNGDPAEAPIARRRDRDDDRARNPDDDGAPDADAAPESGQAHARAEIRRLCEDETIDPDTCAATKRALDQDR